MVSVMPWEMNDLNLKTKALEFGFRIHTFEKNKYEEIFSVSAYRN